MRQRRRVSPQLHGAMQNAGSAPGSGHSARIVIIAATGSSACQRRPAMLMQVTRSLNWLVLEWRRVSSSNYERAHTRRSSPSRQVTKERGCFASVLHTNSHA